MCPWVAMYQVALFPLDALAGPVDIGDAASGLPHPAQCRVVRLAGNWKVGEFLEAPNGFFHRVLGGVDV